MAPSTPPPPSKVGFAALTMASTSRVVMSATITRSRCGMATSAAVAAIGKLNIPRGNLTRRSARFEGFEIGAQRQARARAQACALERGRGCRHARALGNRAALRKHEGKGAVERIAGAGCVGHTDPEGGHVTSDRPLAPEIALHPERDAGMPGTEGEDVLQPLGIGAPGSEVTQRRRREDRVVGEL